MKKRLISILIVAIMLVSAFPVTSAKADYLPDSCPQCGSFNAERLYDEDTFQYVSVTSHIRYKHIACSDCGETSIIEEEEPHDEFDYGACGSCAYPNHNRVVKPNTWYCVGGRPWLKVVVRKKGYLTIKLQGEGGLYLYNKSKKRYTGFGDALEDMWGVPVTKGTYYLRPYHDFGNNQKLKYTFHTNPDKTNFSYKKSVLVKKNKRKIIAFYSSDKEKKWTKWYKFNVTKPKKIYIWENQTPCMITDSKGNDIYLKKVSDSNSCIKYVSRKRLKKGTYHLFFFASWNSAQKKKTTGYMNMFRWDYK